MKESSQYLATERVGKLMAKYAVPCVISLLVGALYNIVDQIFIANATYAAATDFWIGRGAVLHAPFGRADLPGGGVPDPRDLPGIGKERRNRAVNSLGAPKGRTGTANEIEVWLPPAAIVIFIRCVEHHCD